MTTREQRLSAACRHRAPATTSPRLESLRVSEMIEIFPRSSSPFVRSMITAVDSTTCDAFSVSVFGPAFYCRRDVQACASPPQFSVRNRHTVLRSAQRASCPSRQGLLRGLLDSLSTFELWTPLASIFPPAASVPHPPPPSTRRLPPPRQVPLCLF